MVETLNQKFRDFPASFNVYRKDRADVYGGVLVAVKTNYVTELITSQRTKSETETVFVKVTLPCDSKLIGAVYRPTNNDIAYSESVTTQIQSVLKKHLKAVHWIIGDFNLLDVDWQTQSVEGYQYP